MCEADTYQSIVGACFIHPGGGVNERSTVLKWGREKSGDVLLNDCDGRLGMRVDVVGQTPPAKLIPEAVGLVGIVIARQQMPSHRCVSPHPLDDLVARVLGRSCMVVNVARNQYMVYFVFKGELANACDCIQPCQLQACHRRRIGEAEDFANLPVGGMYEAECHCANSFPCVGRDRSMSTLEASEDLAFDPSSTS